MLLDPRIRTSKRPRKRGANHISKPSREAHIQILIWTQMVHIMCIHIYIYTHTYVCACVYTYIHTHIWQFLICSCVNVRWSKGQYLELYMRTGLRQRPEQKNGHKSSPVACFEASYSAYESSRQGASFRRSRPNRLRECIVQTISGCMVVTIKDCPPLCCLTTIKVHDNDSYGVVKIARREQSR